MSVVVCRSALAVTLTMMTFGGSACGSGREETAPTAPVDCVVRLHGKGEGGRPTEPGPEGVVVVRPEAPAEAWGGHEWRYAEPGEYAASRAAVAAAVAANGCRKTVIHGFSNGGAMAAKLYCAGETFGVPVVGFVIDDPVTDDSSVGCSPAPGTPVVLYWTGALADAAPPGTACGDVDWTCEGTVVRPVEEFAADLGTPVAASIHDEHRWFEEPPELIEWLTG